MAQTQAGWLARGVCGLTAQDGHPGPRADRAGRYIPSATASASPFQLGRIVEVGTRHYLLGTT